MAIKFGMTLAQIFNQLVRGYQKITGAEPKGLDLIKIKQEAMRRFKDMNKVVDMEGTPIDQSKGIMGGKQIKEITEDTGEGFIDFVRKTDPESAAKMQKEEDRIRAMIEAANKRAAQKLKDKKIKRESLEDFVDDAGGVDPNDPRGIDDFIPDPDDMAQGGRAGFKEGRIARIFKSLKPFGSENKFTNQLEGILYGEMGLAEGLNLLSQSGLFADGGRIGYKDGPEKPGRRTFMKAAAGLASLLPFGIGKVGKVAAPVVAKAAEITGPALAKLVDTVMSAGKLLSVTGTRVKNMVTKKKLGKVEVEEDIADGSYIIKKDGKEIYYKPGRQDEMGGFDEDIIEVIEDRVKKAGGGIGYMLGE
tara:strand:+ start:24 stop:1106 length:1083 start_codon:yes stop_codon:yes gene_type:complete